ncbi:hypothetical protein [Actinoplanes sp. NPDC051411]|uniref:hypothetical protein n=1 Tax=Actinoplanes sp. NPDC051411 TaxID=3155522 RepID=UPI00343C74AE
MTPVPFTNLHFAFLAPYLDTGHRLDNLPTAVQGASATSVRLTATTPGIYLFQIRLDQQYIVARLQVHRTIESWWFGAESITTAQDQFAHAQPSIFARFSDDTDTGADLIGDITGHGFVQLTSTDASTFTVTGQGRLLGLKPTDPGADNDHIPKVRGQFLGATAAIPVRVVDYNTPRTDLQAVAAPGYAQAPDRQNLLFLAEGFLNEDRDLFDKIVARVQQELFTKQRHQPYGLLKDSFNVFKHFLPSRQRALTPAFRVLDRPLVQNGKQVLPQGAPFPPDDPFPNTFSPQQLVAFVGLPRRGENRDPAVLRNLWRAQGLTAPPSTFNPDNVSDDLIRAWQQESPGIVQARDTVFGLQLGRRLADRASSRFPDGIHQDQPPGDDGTMTMAVFVKRLYEFWNPQRVAHREIRNDPRRHPPELYALADQKAQTEPTNPNNAVARLFGGLQFSAAGHTFPIGQQWAPKDTQFQRSRGLVAIIVLDDFHSGRNINNFSMTAQSVNGKTVLSVAYTNPSDPRELPRTVDGVSVDFDDVINKVGHEIGHSFNLGDENEDFPGAEPRDPAGAVDQDLAGFDNIAILASIKPRPPQTVPPSPATSPIDPDRVKWLTLPRMAFSSRVVTPTDNLPNGNILVTIDPADVGQWVQARADFPNLLVSLRLITIDGLPNQQLPLGDLIEGLSIVGDIDESAGQITLTGAAIPKPTPTFFAGSVLFVPLGNNTGTPLLAADRKVLAHMRSTLQPLNPNKDKTKASNVPEDPESFDGFRAPCKAYRVIGVYEGALHQAAGRYRPAGACKMRNHATEDSDPGSTTTGGTVVTISGFKRGKDENRNKDDGAEYCFVCKWLIVNRVDPGMHRILSDKFYPTAKSSEDDDI